MLHRLNIHLQLLVGLLPLLALVFLTLIQVADLHDLRTESLNAGLHFNHLLFRGMHIHSFLRVFQLLAPLLIKLEFLFQLVHPRLPFRIQLNRNSLKYFGVDYVGLHKRWLVVQIFR